MDILFSMCFIKSKHFLKSVKISQNNFFLFYRQKLMGLNILYPLSKSAAIQLSKKLKPDHRFPSHRTKNISLEFSLR